MSFKVKKKKETSTLYFGSKITIDKCGSIKEKFLEKIENDTEKVIFNLKKTEKIDTAGTQLILSIMNSMKKKNITIEFLDKNDFFDQAFLKRGIHIDSF
ncbi:MAG: STAS domain-containing protein [Deltaproteobacteria bacterium]|nr:STAS domain-containing protein [Deltaproteobacteria bacterium]